MSAIREDLDQFVERLQATAGANVEAVVLYGSAARNDFNEKYSDVNLLVVLREARGKALDQVAPVVEWWTKKLHHHPPLFVTEEELRASADVFAIETLDIKASHRLLFARDLGRDLLAAIEVPMNLHRVQLEHELRTLLLKLRQHFLLAHGNHHELEHALAKSASSVVTLFRHALIALGRTAPDSRRDVVLHIAQFDGVDAAPLNAALDLREGRRVELGIDALYHRYMDSIAALIRHIDQAAPTRHWQRVGNAPS